MTQAISKFAALVPMKGHSERVPNKNLRLFGKKPLYHHIVGTLLQCPHVDCVYINTDSPQIASDVAQNFKDRVRLIQRPKEICGDFVSMNVVINHDLSQVEGKYFLQTHSTNPLLKPETVTRAIETFLSHPESDSLFGVNPFHGRFYDAKGDPINHNPEEMLRTQDLPPLFEENSNLYLFSRESFIKTGRRIGKRPILHPVSKLESIDIDTEEDFKLATFVYEYLKTT
ncbi:MAG: acylneuraminate cytidylyltransferase family protein [Deltaproteobacteria bacterium]|nr:acylneuraminate cytidylyltransferase family protein [Deltaproteobacteria bacterium]